eukprot:8222753-Pyramimonas_sp.AAC.1
MGVLTELASAKGLSAFALSLDIQKAFEQVRHKLLIRRASEFGCHPAILRGFLTLHRPPRVVTLRRIVGERVRASKTIVA